MFYLETRRDKRESNPDTDYDYDYEDTQPNPEYETKFPKLDNDLLFELDLPSPPQKLLLNLNVYLDKIWTIFYGTHAGNLLAKRILKHASEFLAHESLTTKIELVYDSSKFYNSSQNLVPSKEAFDNLLPQELIGPDDDGEGHPTAHLYLTGAKHPINGRSIIDGMCTGSTKQKPRVIVRVQKSEDRMAMTVAHEIGHMLGMEQWSMTSY